MVPTKKKENLTGFASAKKLVALGCSPVSLMVNLAMR